MQVCTEQMVQDIRIIEKRLNQIQQHLICTVTRNVMITEEDHNNLAFYLVKLDRYLYWTDLKGSLPIRTTLLKFPIVYTKFPTLLKFPIV